MSTYFNFKLFIFCWLDSWSSFRGTPWRLNHFTVIKLYQQQSNIILIHITYCKHQAPSRASLGTFKLKLAHFFAKPVVEVTPSLKTPLLSTFTHINTSNLNFENFLLNTLKKYKLTRSSTVANLQLYTFHWSQKLSFGELLTWCRPKVTHQVSDMHFSFFLQKGN